MSQSFTIKRGDTSPGIEYALLPASISLVGASVRFQMRQGWGARETIVDEPATVVTATVTPTVQYAWQAGNTAVAGFYEAEFRVVYADNTVETFPNSGFIGVLVSDDVEDAP